MLYTLAVHWGGHSIIKSLDHRNAMGSNHNPKQCTVQSSHNKCSTYKRYNFIHVECVLLMYKNTICRTSECYVLSVITCFAPFFVNYNSISVNFQNIKVAIVCQCGKVQKILAKWSLLANIQVTII